MKKITISIIISVVMMFSLCACGGKGNTSCKPDLNKSFCITAHMEYDGMTADAVIKRLGNANWDAEFSTPNTLAGVLLSFRDANVEASYKGLSFSVPKSALPLKSILSSFIEIIDNIAQQPEITGEEKENEIITEGETELGKYTLKFDKNGYPTGFEMPNLSLVITFSDFCDYTPGTTEETTEAEAIESTTEAVENTESEENSEVSDESESDTENDESEESSDDEETEVTEAAATDLSISRS